MKLKKIVSLITALVLIFSASQLSVFANEQEDAAVVTDNGITLVFHDEVSEETKEKIIAHFAGETSSNIQARGITCTLLGHNLETGATSAITHKAKATAPRCLKETFEYEICTRCDYSEYTLIGSEYIYCCS